jgi:hypothetical protein
LADEAALSSIAPAAALVETNDLPVIPIVVLGVLAGSVGGAIGRLFTGSSGSRAAARM